MGLIRFLLAISVVLAHTNKIFGIGLVGGRLAVQVFYIISGFYMTLILKEKYIGKNGSYKLFITNRLLRLYPIYWAVLILTVLASLGIFMFSSSGSLEKLQPYYDYFNSMDIGSIVFLIFSNVTLFFQDMVMFMGLDVTSGALFFAKNFRLTDPQLHTFLLVPQAWTIGVEIMFYLIAPFIVRRRLKIIALFLVLSLLLRIILYYNGFNQDPWTYRFFPTEIFFFLLGAIAYHAYKRLESYPIKKSSLRLVYLFLLACTFSYSWLPSSYKIFFYIFVFTISLPFIFKLSKNWKRDRYIGELSYPIYISHLFVLMIVNQIDIPFMKKPGLITVIFTIVFSLLINRFIAEKIERIRQNRLKKNSSEDSKLSTT